MARNLRNISMIGACAALAAGCVHASPQAIAQGPELPALGEDMPQTVIAAPPQVAPAKLLSVDTPVGKLCGNSKARAVIDRDLPGLTSRPEYVFFKHMSLRQLQAASQGQMSVAELEKVSVDLDAIDPAAAKPFLRASATSP